eukprot:364615-Chlamydomonas_euryale.AAC.17
MLRPGRISRKSSLSHLEVILQLGLCAGCTQRERRSTIQPQRQHHVALLPRQRHRAIQSTSIAPRANVAHTVHSDAADRLHAHITGACGRARENLLFLSTRFPDSLPGIPRRLL